MGQAKALHDGQPMQRRRGPDAPIRPLAGHPLGANQDQPEHRRDPREGPPRERRQRRPQEQAAGQREHEAGAAPGSRPRRSTAGCLPTVLGFSRALPNRRRRVRTPAFLANSHGDRDSPSGELRGSLQWVYVDRVAGREEAIAGRKIGQAVRIRQGPQVGGASPGKRLNHQLAVLPPHGRWEESRPVAGLGVVCAPVARAAAQDSSVAGRPVSPTPRGRTTRNRPEC